MGSEIERKFLVRDVSVISGDEGTEYLQGYLSVDPDRTVRVRISDNEAFLTIKGRSHGPTRAEYEYRIPVDDAREMLATVALRSLIAKTRHVIAAGGLRWEVDVFHGINAGLVIAEVEIPSADYPVPVPPWVGEEITDDYRYSNASLALHPYRDWAGTAPAG
jgi:adenylate cyclase